MFGFFSIVSYHETILMKLTIRLFSTLFFMAFFLPTFGQGIAPNNFIIQPYVGGPNLKTWSYNAIQLGQTTDHDGYSVNAKGFGHFGVTTELAISERIGLGIDGIYSPFERTIIDSSSNETKVFTENKLRIIARIYIHFNVENPSWDLYLSGGIGANILFTSLKRNGVNENYNAYYKGNTKFPLLNTPFPVSGRFCFGGRYYFSHYVGINFEAGIGGPPFSFGLSFRL